MNKRVALIIGNGNYQTVDKLKNPATMPKMLRNG